MTDAKVDFENVIANLNAMLDDLNAGFGTNTIESAIEFINRQKAEIERLCQEIDELIIAKDSLFDEAEALIKKAKSEAVKELADRSEKELFINQDEHRKHWMETLNRHRGTEAYKDHEWSIDNWLRGYGEAVQDILGVHNNLLKEMAGDEDGNILPKL